MHHKVNNLLKDVLKYYDFCFDKKKCIIHSLIIREIVNCQLIMMKKIIINLMIMMMKVAKISYKHHDILVTNTWLKKDQTRWTPIPTLLNGRIT